MANRLWPTRLFRVLSIACLSTALAACGGGGSGGGSNSSISVPNVVGSSQTAATTSVTGAGLTIGTVTTQSSTTVASGNVISESPAAGTSATKGSAVALVVSSGPAMVSVPNVVGSMQAAAMNSITGAGLTVGTVTTQSSATVAGGTVISENPAAGASVASGSAVALVVSTGPSTSNPKLGGIVVGLTSGQTVHVLNGADNVPISANGAFQFPTALASGQTYNVTIGSPQPTGQTCAVANGAGTAASSNIYSVVVYCTVNVTTASLTGAYTMVSDQINQQQDLLATLTLDGAGNYTGTGTTDTNNVIASVAPTGTYAIATTPASVPYLTTNGGNGQGAVEYNANAFVLLTSATSGAQPGLAIGVKQAQNVTASSVNGTYTGVSLENTSPISSTIKTDTVSNGTFSNGAGQTNSNGTISTGTASSGLTYTVTSSGAITVGTGGAGVSGAVSADGDLIVAAPITNNGNGSTPGIYVLVKQGTGVTAATIDGVYTMVSLSTGASLTANDGKSYLVSMASGAFGGAYFENNAGTVTTATNISGTYTLAADGTMNMVVSGGGQTLTGAVSADGNVFVLADMTSGEKPTLLVGVRQ